MYYQQVNENIFSENYIGPTGGMCVASGHDRAGDCIFWNASNEHGWWFALGMAQRPNDVINLFLVVKVPGVGTFVNDQLPTTSNVKVSSGKTRRIGA